MATAERNGFLIDEAAFAKASEQGARLLTRGPLATAAHFDAGRIHVDLNNGCAFVFPTEQVAGLSGADSAALQTIEIQGAGMGLYWPRLDVDLYVPSLIRGVLGTKLHMAEIGAAGGRTTSAAKAKSSRANGKLGGRPKKQLMG